ncbi:Collagen alpha-5(VI) chain [Stylophora pistillata]|uniref:Collagen alpha-5(VI) chain n=1 Tax=Stylophora pistillata TaxID=50429 RepID=A0A2B4SFK1_STYPI|nr:Collagen alpha-5(VI) chain [Stylophora pistillata]
MSVKSTKETTNYARLCRLLIEVGGQALRDKFNDIVKPENLESKLKNFKVQLEDLKKKRILNPVQWNCLYPLRSSTVSSKNFDITTLCVLLTNICNVTRYKSCPDDTDLSLGADIFRIRHIRNAVYAHVTKAAIDDVDFSKNWSDIQDVILRIGEESYKATIEEVGTVCMDPELAEFQKELFKQWRKDDDIIKEKLDKRKLTNIFYHTLDNYNKEVPVLKDKMGKDGRDGRDGRNAGEKGEKGAQGLPGDDGMKGIKGEQGAQGLPGDDGMKGFKGDKGGQGFKGQKGEPGSSFVRKHPGGIFKFDDVSVNCTPSSAGTVGYNVSQNALQFCDGRSWLLLLTAPAADPKKVKQGHEPQKPGRQCLDILKAGDSRGSRLYWIDPNGGSTDDSFQAFCDMESEGGGWTLVATKVSPSFLFIKTTFSASAAKTTGYMYILVKLSNFGWVFYIFPDLTYLRGSTAHVGQFSCHVIPRACTLLLMIIGSRRDGRDGHDGKMGEKVCKANSKYNGQKGKPGSEGKSPQGVIKFGDTAVKCTKRTAGTVRYKVPQNALLLCDGRNWLPLMTGGKGHLASRPGRHCMDILRSGEIMFRGALKAD